MKADVVHAEGQGETVEGHWENQQDPITGEIIRVWVPADSDPSTPEYTYKTYVDCLARGYVGTGLRGGGTGEDFGAIYQASDTIRIWFPASVNLSRKDQITNVRGPKGNIVWKEDDEKATVFDVMGVTPLFDMFNQHIENYALCERSEIQ